jgi:glycosyltransferase involved in cell wall biosynthesis
MKILQVCAVDFTLYHFLMPLIREMAGRDHDVIAACADGLFVKRVRAEGLRVETIPFSRNIVALWGHVRAYRALVLMLRKEQVDIIQVHTPIAAAIGRLAAWRAKVPIVVYTAHGFYFHERMWAVQRLIFVAIEWFLGRFTDVLFTQSQEDALTAERFGLCRTGIIKAIGNGVSSDIFHPPLSSNEKELKRKSLGTETQACVIIIVARLVAEKGYRELFAAMNDLDAELWIVGERLQSDHARNVGRDIERVLRNPAGRGKFKFLGHRDDVPELLRAADIFVLPSYREGMPRSIIEAMMTGLPVVATNIRGSREEVCHGSTGLLVNAGVVGELRDALDTLMKDESLRISMGLAGSEKAMELFDEKTVIARQITALSL